MLYEDRDFEWQGVRKKMQAVSLPFEERSKDAGPSPYFGLSADEEDRLRQLASLAPATRSYAEVRTMLNLLRGCDLLLQLDEDAAAKVAGAMRLTSYGKGDMILTEQLAADAFLLILGGLGTVLVRDTTKRPPRAPLFNVYPGECFNEQALVENSRTAPSLVAGEGCVLLRVCKADFQAASSSWHLEMLERKVTALQNVPCFVHEERRALRPIAERMTQEKVHANTVLVAQGSEATKLYVIGSGEARVLMQVDNSPELLQVATIGPHSLFGEVGLIKGTLHSASVVSASDMTLYVLGKSELFAVAEPWMLEQLSELVHGYPPESKHRESLDLSNHWRAFKGVFTRSSLESTRAAASLSPTALFGGRPPLPRTHRDRQLPRSAAIASAYTVCPDGTPISQLDVKDMQVRFHRRERSARHPNPVLEAQLQTYLSTKPGGSAWTGNAHLREYAAREAAKDREARLRRSRRLAAACGEGDASASAVVGGGGRSALAAGLASSQVGAMVMPYAAPPHAQHFSSMPLGRADATLPPASAGRADTLDRGGAWPSYHAADPAPPTAASTAAATPIPDAARTMPLGCAPTLSASRSATGMFAASMPLPSTQARHAPAPVPLALAQVAARPETVSARHLQQPSLLAGRHGKRLMRDDNRNPMQRSLHALRVSRSAGGAGGALRPTHPPLSPESLRPLPHSPLLSGRAAREPSAIEMGGASVAGMLSTSASAPSLGHQQRSKVTASPDFVMRS